MRVSKVGSDKQLLSAYEAMCDDTWTEMGKGIGSVAIIEEYIDGDEYSIEGYLDQGEPVIISITKKILGASPFFVELGHVVNARLSESCKKMIEDYVKSLCSLINLNVGVIHFFSLPFGKKTFSAVLGLEAIQNLYGYYASELYYQPGDLVPPLTDFRGRVGYVIFVCEQYDLLCDNMRLAKELVVFN